MAMLSTTGTTSANNGMPDDANDTMHDENNRRCRRRWKTITKWGTTSTGPASANNVMPDDANDTKHDGNSRRCRRRSRTTTKSPRLARHVYGVMPNDVNTTDDGGATRVIPPRISIRQTSPKRGMHDDDNSTTKRGVVSDVSNIERMPTQGSVNDANPIDTNKDR